MYFFNNRFKDDYKCYILQLCKFMIQKGMKIRPLPKLKIINNDVKNSNSIFGKTAYYDKNLKKITLFTLNRHSKDILRSFAHEMVHHEQNLKGLLNNINDTNTNKNIELEKLEREAYEKGNIMLRNWEDSIKDKIKESKKYIPKLGDMVRVDKKWFNDGKERVGKIVKISPNGERLEISSDLYPRRFLISTKNVNKIENKYKKIKN